MSVCIVSELSKVFANYSSQHRVSLLARASKDWAAIAAAPTPLAHFVPPALPRHGGG